MSDELTEIRVLREQLIAKEDMIEQLYKSFKILFSEKLNRSAWDKHERGIARENIKKIFKKWGKNV